MFTVFLFFYFNKNTILNFLLQIIKNFILSITNVPKICDYYKILLKFIKNYA